jgi:hypothetical protein
MSAVLEIFSGENNRLTRSLLRHGFFWLIFSILFDYSTSWIMMSLKGPMSEGNPVPRAFFDERNIATFLALVGSQWVWIFFVLAAGGAYFASRNVVVSGFISSRKLGV